MVLAEEIELNLLSRETYGHDPLNAEWKKDVELFGDKLITQTLQIGDTVVDYEKMCEAWDGTVLYNEKNRSRYYANKKKNETKSSYYTYHKCIVAIEAIPVQPEKINPDRCERIRFDTIPPLDVQFTKAKYPPMPVYVYTFKARISGKYAYIQDQRQIPRDDVTLREIYYLIAYAIRQPFNQVRTTLPLAMKQTAPESLTPKYWLDRPKQEFVGLSVYKKAMPRFAAEIYGRAFYLAYCSAINALVEFETNTLGNRMKEVAKGGALYENDMRLKSAMFARHPEVIRYFGGKAFSDLCEYYEERWLMGVRLDKLYEIYYLLANAPLRLVDLQAEDKLISFTNAYNMRFSYGDHQPLTIKSFIRAIRQFQPVMDPSDMLIAFVASIIADCCGGERSKHRYITYPTLVSYIHHEKEIKEIIEKHTKMDKSLDEYLVYTIVSMAKNKNVMLVDKHLRRNLDSYINGKSFWEQKEFLSDLAIYPRTTYFEDAMILYCLHQLLDRYVNLPPEKRLPTRISEFQAPVETCSEQMEAGCKICRGPCANFCGAGGSGKTQELVSLYDMFEWDEILIVTFMGAHANNARKRIMAHQIAKHGPNGANMCRISTIHKIISVHSTVCTRCFPFLAEHNGQKRAEKLRSGSLAALAEMCDSRNPDEPDHRVSREDALFNYPFVTCPFEKVKVVVFEECSVLYHNLAATMLWIVTRCSPNLTNIITVGDLNQLAPLQSGHFHKDMVEGLYSSTIWFNHMHRFEGRILGENAAAIAQGNMEKFNIDNERVFIKQVDKFNYLDQIDEMINIFDAHSDTPITIENTQFISRTNEIKNKVAEYVLWKLCLKNEKPQPFTYYRKETITPKVTIGDIMKNSLLEVVCSLMVEVRMLARTGFSHEVPDMDVKAMEQVDEMARLTELKNSGLSNEQMIDISLETSLSTKSLEIVKDKIHQELYLLFEAVMNNQLSFTDCRNRLNANYVIPFGKTVSEAMIKQVHATDGGTFDFKVVAIAPTTKNDIVNDNIVQVLVLKDKVYRTQNTALDRDIPNQLYFIPLISGFSENLTKAGCVTNYFMQGSQADTVCVVLPYVCNYDTMEALYTASTRAVNRIIYFVPGPSSLKKMMETPEPIRNSLLSNSIQTLFQCYEPFMPKDTLSTECNVCLEILEDGRYGLNPRNNLCTKYQNEYGENDDCLDISHSKKPLKRMLSKLEKKGTNFDSAKWDAVSKFLQTKSDRSIPWCSVAEAPPKPDIPETKQADPSLLENEISKVFPNAVHHKPCEDIKLEEIDYTPSDIKLEEGKILWH